MADRSDEAVARALVVVLRDHGWDVAANPRRLRGGLNDVLGADADVHRAAVDAVVLAVEEGVVADLLTAGRDAAEQAVPGLVGRLGEWGLAPGPATWAVGTWATHLPVTTVQPPDTHPRVLAPTTLPPEATSPQPDLTLAPPAAPQERNAAPRAPEPTVVPPAAREAPAVPRRRRPSARTLTVAGAIVAILGVGVATAVAMSSGATGPITDPPTGAPTESGGDTQTGTPAVPAPADPGTLFAASETRPAATDRPLAMAARRGGVRVARLGEVETAGTGDDARSAPVRGRLLAFRLADWDCGSDSCRPWQQLGLDVDVDGDRQPLPNGSDTFAVAVPAGAGRVDLVLRADGMTQTISLLDGKTGADNVAVLARGDRVDEVDLRFTMTERTSIAFDYAGTVTDTIPRTVTVSRAELVWFADGARPSSTRRAYLKVNMHYTIPFGPDGKPYAFELRELGFVGADGTTYRALDLDKGPDIQIAFEVPSGLAGGRLVLGGGSYAAQSSAGSYTRTLTSRSVPLRFG